MRISDRERISKICQYADRLHTYVQENHISKEDLISDYSLQWLVTTPLYNIGEHAYNVSAEYKSAHDEIPWHMMAGLRHRLVHDYDGTKWDVIADVVLHEIPVLAEQFKTLVHNA